VVKDQQTVAIGGLMRDNQSVSVSKVPILGDIPIIGWLFKSKETKTTKTNLLLFLTPYIINDKDDFRRIFERKMRERKEFIERFYGAGSEFEVYIDYNKKHGPFFEMNKKMNSELDRFENGGKGRSDEILITPDMDIRQIDKNEENIEKINQQQNQPTDVEKKEGKEKKDDSNVEKSDDKKMEKDSKDKGNIEPKNESEGQNRDEHLEVQ